MTLPGFEPEVTIFLDVEAYFDPKSGYTLKKMSTEQYVRSPLFEMIGIGVAVNDGEPEWMEASEFAAEAKHIPWERCAVGAHNTEFDALILSHHYNVHPGLLIDTLAMGRLLHGTQMSLRLENLAKHYAVGEKGHEIDKAEGKHRADFSQDEWLRYGEYCKQDVRLCRAIYMKMIDEGFPDSELWVVDLITRMFTEPQFILDEPLLKAYLIEERQRKAALMRKVAGVGPEVPDAQIDPLVRPHLMSNPKFAEALMDSGVVPPRKVSPTTGKETWAFAKSDPGMQALLESEDEEVRLLVEARVGVKSTINESRTERFLKLGAGGRLMPIQINYAAAHTSRCGGAGGTNFLNLERTNKKNPKKGTLRKSMLAPPGYMVVVVDSGQIEARVNAWFSGHVELLAAFARDEDVYSAFASKVYGRPIDRKTVKEDEIPGAVGKACLGPDTLVLTQRGWVRIVEVQREDLLWDGEEWVTHQGLSYQGVKETVEHCAVVATEDHLFLTRGGWREWSTVRTNPSLFQSAVLLASSLSLAGTFSTTSVGYRPAGTLPFDASVDGLAESHAPGLSAAGLPLVPSAPTPICVGSQPKTPGSLGSSARSRFRSEPCSETSPCCGGGTQEMDAVRRQAGARWSGVSADGRAPLRGTIYSEEQLRDAMRAPNSLRRGNDGRSTKSCSRTTRIGSGCLIGSARALLGAIIRKTKPILVMAAEAFWSTQSGGTIAQRFFGTSSLCPAGITLRSSWTARTTVKGTNPGTSASLRAKSTQETGGRCTRCSPGLASLKKRTPVYDLLCAGTRQRFTILSSAGPLIVHNSVLGLGYSLGPAKFAAVMLQGALGGPKIQFGEAEADLMGVDVLKFCASAHKLARVRDMPSRLPLEERIIHCAVCEFIVYQWRNANRPVVEMWKTMDAVIGGMLDENVSYTFGPGGVLSTVRHGIRLPNGTVMRYPGLKRSEEEDGKPRGFSYLGGGGGKQWQRCYGGLCLENCIQALSRIIASDQMLALYAKYRYRPALWPYDELVYVVPEADALQVKTRCLEEMKKAPSWAPGLPLAADAGIGASYGAAK